MKELNDKQRAFCEAVGEAFRLDDAKEDRGTYGLSADEIHFKHFELLSKQISELRTLYSNHLAQLESTKLNTNMLELFEDLHHEYELLLNQHYEENFKIHDDWSEQVEMEKQK